MSILLRLSLGLMVIIALYPVHGNSVYAKDSNGLDTSLLGCDEIRDISVTECEVLHSLFTSWAGSTWIWETGDTQWFTNTDACLWSGVGCSKDPETGWRYITYLSNRWAWPDGESTYSVPESVGQLSRLVSLHLRDSRFSGEIPGKALAQLPNLTHLTLCCQFTGSIPAELGVMSSLRELRLGHNQLTGLIPPELGNLQNLRRFDLSSNDLVCTIPPEMGQLVNLEDGGFDLSSNDLSGPLPPELANIPNLTNADLHNNRFSGPIPSEILNHKDFAVMQLPSMSDTVWGRCQLFLSAMTGKPGSVFTLNAELPASAWFVDTTVMVNFLPVTAQRTDAERRVTLNLDTRHLAPGTYLIQLTGYPEYTTQMTLDTDAPLREGDANYATAVVSDTVSPVYLTYLPSLKTPSVSAPAPPPAFGPKVHQIPCNDWMWIHDIPGRSIGRCLSENEGEIVRINQSFTLAPYGPLWISNHWSLTAEAYLVQGDNDYGIIFDYYWAFVVRPTQGTYSLMYIPESGRPEGTPPVDWTPSPHVRRGNEVNVLRVERKGADVSLYLNDQLMWTGNDLYERYGFAFYTKAYQDNSITRFRNIRATAYPSVP